MSIWQHPIGDLKQQILSLSRMSDFPIVNPPANFLLSVHSSRWLTKNAALWIWDTVSETSFFSYVSAGFYPNKTFTISIQTSSPTNRFCTLKITWLLCFTKKYSLFWVQMKTPDYFTSSPIQGIASGVESGSTCSVTEFSTACS